jgi:hypothetical protein
MNRAARMLLLVLVCLTACGLAACTRETIQAGDARLTFGRASVQVAPPTGPFRGVADDVRLEKGDRVKITYGNAELRLAHGARLLLRSGSQVTVAEAPALVHGDAVALPGPSDPLTVRSLDSRVDVLTGVTRVRTGFTVVAGVYRGTARLVSAGRTLTVPALRQGEIPAFGVVAEKPTPLNYRASDTWDLHYLGVAVEMGEELQASSASFTDQVKPTEGHTPGFFRALLPSLPSASFNECQPELLRPAGETLVGASIALAGPLARFEQRCRAAFAFRDQGASWGLVALDQQVRELPALRRELEVAIGRLPSSLTVGGIDRTFEVAVSSTEPPLDPGVETPRSAPSVPSEPAPAPPAPTAPSVPILPGPSTPIVPGVPAVPTPGPVAEILDPVTNLVGGLLDGLLS